MLGDDEVFLLNADVADSLDSHYLGLLPASQMVGYLSAGCASSTDPVLA